ncbi:hypothetical protein B484DRAFT_157477 [Ochromonadaceae sp. CCMP2298]|nr:hypothetical protein B484DRAFT_157477 [Ochromonadaceae sp. CCMP2298]
MSLCTRIWVSLTLYLSAPLPISSRTNDCCAIHWYLLSLSDSTCISPSLSLSSLPFLSVHAYIICKKNFDFCYFFSILSCTLCGWWVVVGGRCNVQWAICCVYAACYVLCGMYYVLCTMY